MRYHSELDQIRKAEDHSYPTVEDRLLWRYEELQDRYEELLDAHAPCSGEDYFSWEDYRYAPTQCFGTITDVYRAMEIAKEELWSRCGIAVRKDGSMEMRSDAEQDPDQLTVWEIVYLPMLLGAAVAV